MVLTVLRVACRSRLAFTRVHPTMTQQRGNKKLTNSLDFLLPLHDDAATITALVEEIRAKHMANLDAIAGLQDPSNATFDDTFGALAAADAASAAASAQTTFPALVHGSPEVRTAASDAKKALQAMWSDAYSRGDVHAALLAWAEASGIIRKGNGNKRNSNGDDSPSAKRRQQQGNRALDAEEERLVVHSLRRFESNGCGLENQADRAALAAARRREGDLSARFEQNLNEDTTKVAFEEAELTGMPPSFISSLDHEEGSGRLLISTKAPQLVPVLRLCERSSTRKEMKRAAASVCSMTNGPILKQLVEARNEAAKLLGRQSHAELIIAPKMAASVSRVEDFINDMYSRVAAPLTKDLAQLRALKREHLESAVHGEGTGVDAKTEKANETEDSNHNESGFTEWDVAFYARLFKEKHHAVNDEEIRQYFPLERVQRETLAVYQDLLGVRFERLDTQSPEDGGVVPWHPDVQCYAVADSATGELLGHFFVDLFSRDGKFAHQMVVPLRPSYVKHSVERTEHGVGGEDENRVTPVCAILGNMSRPEGSRPSLLRFAEVKTFFHEFGHVLHCILSKPRFSLFSWAWPIVPWPGGVQQDFLEVPSMAFEQWVFEDTVLQRLSGHFSDESKKLPQKHINSLRDTRFLNSGYSYARFLAMAKFDMIMHSSKPPYTYDGQSGLSIEELWGRVMASYIGFEPLPGTHFPAGWYHMAIGYDAGYWSYLWSEVFAMDVFAAFGERGSASGCLDPVLGAKLRREILETGATKDGFDMLRAFLGRDPSPDAFMKITGLAGN